MRRLLCLFGHDDAKRVVLQPLGPDDDDPSIMYSKLREERTCNRCGRVKVTEEIIPLQYIISDD